MTLRGERCMTSRKTAAKKSNANPDIKKDCLRLDT